MGGDDWRAVILKEQQRSYQHSIENEWMVTQHRHRGMLFALVNGFISQFALGSAKSHGNLTARSSLPAYSGAFWKSIDYLVPTSSRKDASPLMIPMPTGISDILQLEAEWGEDDAEDNEAEDNEADKANKDNGGRGGRGGRGQGRLCVGRDLRVFIKQ
ncbi:hypothetical protein V8E54_008527 [Elaphomyces granulatus]